MKELNNQLTSNKTGMESLAHLLVGSIIVLLILLLAIMLKSGIPCAIYVPTPIKVIRKMLDLVSLKPNEVLYDLGCGDGRIVLLAAKEYGAYAVGVEYNPFLVWVARRNIKKSGVRNRVSIIKGNLFNISLRDADVVTIYLSQYANARLKKKFEMELKPGARVVSYVFPINGWKPFIKDEKYRIFVYKVPESIISHNND